MTLKTQQAHPHHQPNDEALPPEPTINEFRYKSEIGKGSSLKITHRQKILKALLGDKNGDFPAWQIGLQINECSKHSPCKHPLCPFCRYKHQLKSAKEMNKLFASASRSDLHFVTVLFDVTYDIDTITKDYIDGIKRQWINLIGRRARKDERYKGITWWGSFEVDVKSPKHVSEGRPLNTMTALGMNDWSDKPCFLPHLHLVVNLNGVTKDEFKEDLKSLWDKSYQVRVQKFHGEKTTEENLTNLAMYMTKFRVQYSENLDTGSDPEEVGIEDEDKEYKRTQYKDLYEPVLIRAFSLFLSQAGKFNRITFKTQAGKKKVSTPVEPTTSSTTEVESDDIGCGFHRDIVQGIKMRMEENQENSLPSVGSLVVRNGLVPKETTPFI